MPKPSAVISVDLAKHDKAIEVEGVRLTHPDKVVFPGNGITKRQLAAYYLLVKDRILPHVARRPLALVRCPDGRTGDVLLTRSTPRRLPDAVQAGPRSRRSDGTDAYLYIEDVGACRLPCRWACWRSTSGARTRPSLEKPDRVVFDLDPDEDIPFAGRWRRRQRCATGSTALGLETFPMTTGGKGLHVVAPLTPRTAGTTSKGFCRGDGADHGRRRSPKRYLASPPRPARTGRIFVDYLRNGRGATAIGPYSTRARSAARRSGMAGDLGASRPSRQRAFCHRRERRRAAQEAEVGSLGRLLRCRPSTTCSRASRWTSGR